MKELTEEILIKTLRYSSKDALIFLLRKHGIGCCGNHTLTKVELIDLSQNDFQTMKKLFQQFPLGWWFNLSGNTLVDSFQQPIPFSLGLLDLSGTQIQALDCFDPLSDSLIFRLNLDLRTNKEGNITRQQLFKRLPKIWVLNNDFVKYDELFKMANACDDESEMEVIPSDFFTSIPSNYAVSSDLFNPKIPTEREQDVIEVLTKLIPSRKSLSEFYRLDLVVDDYLQQAHIFNNHPEVMRGLYKRMPTLSCNKLLAIPHRVRLDISALLTATILFPMPKSLLMETMDHLLIPYLSQDEIHQLLELPNFVKTGLVSLFRRICVKEKQEYELNGYLSIKPSPPDQQLHDTVNPAKIVSLPPRDASGFRFLSFLRKYLGSPIGRSLPQDPSSVPFSEMEIDLLHFLPDIPTVASCPLPSSAAYRDWVSLTARHSVILMSRSPNCPSLTKPQTSMNHEILLKQLRPLLVAAEMTYEDLEITTTGPSIDGRVTQTSHVLSFGKGVPDGRPSSLVWNANGASRNYQRPWIQTSKPPIANDLTEDNPIDSNLHEAAQPEGADEIASIGDSFFSSNHSDAGVDGELSPPNRKSSNNVIRAEVRNRSKAGDSDSEASLRSYDMLRKQGSQQSSTALSELARGLSLDVGLGLKPWESRSIAENGLSPKLVSGYSDDHLNVPSFTLGSPSSLSSDSRWKEISEAPVIIHPLSKSPIVLENNAPPGVSGPLSPILEEKSQEVHPLDLTAINLQRLPNLNAIGKKESFQASARTFTQSGRKSIERTESASSIGSWKSISRSNSEMISRCNSMNSNNEIPLHQLPPRERKFKKQQQIALNKSRVETQKWLSRFNTNLVESFPAGPENMDIKQFFLAFDEKKDMLLAKGKALASGDSQDIDYTYSDSNIGSHEDDSTVYTYVGKSTGDVKEDLFRDMGTTRNINQLKALNKKNQNWLKEQKRLEESRKHKRGYQSIPKTLTSPYSIQTHSSDMKPLPLSLPKLSWAAFQSPSAETTKKPQEVFLTESDFSVTLTPPVSNDEVDKLQPVSEHVIETPEHPSPKSPNSELRWDPTVPLAKQLRQTLKYDHVYSSSRAEWGVTGPAGQISSTWYQYPQKVVYTLDPNAPLDIVRNEIITKTNLSMKKKDSNLYDPSVHIKIPLQPRVYQNRYLPPSVPIYYETIPNQRYHVQRGQEGFLSSEIKTDENSNSVTTFTVNLSPTHSIHEDHHPTDIDLESIDGQRVTSAPATRNGTAKVNEELPKFEDAHDTASASYTRGNTPLITSIPAHERTPNVNTLEKLLGDLPEEMKYQLPPVTTPATRIRDSMARSKQMVVQIDPEELPITVTTTAMNREKVSVFKPVTTKLKLNSSFKQTIPRGYLHGGGAGGRR